MIEQLLLALLLTGITVAIHVSGAVRIVLPWASRGRHLTDYRQPREAVMLLVRLVSGLLLLHMAEMAVWAAAFTLAGVFDEFETAMYFSLKSYTTVGYGDVLPPRSWRLLGPIEAAVGVLMLGISTSIIVAAVQRIHFAGAGDGGTPDPAARRTRNAKTDDS
ncbi:MAG: hypothetical protein DCC68_23585 [Planctomycetota bacterium]|nr:MAG: hypothetical protein DCC68_23585 [Planctomycetota bacterium]